MTKAWSFLKEGPKLLHESTLWGRSLRAFKQNDRAGKSVGISYLAPFIPDISPCNESKSKKRGKSND